MGPARSFVVAVALLLGVSASAAGCGGGDDDAPPTVHRDGGPDAADAMSAPPDAQTPPGCGDGARGAGEACDDGNVIAGDGCSPGCEIERGFRCEGSPSRCRSACGDRVIASDEACDDGNTRPLDGCNPACGLEAGWSCTGEPSVCTMSCGDGRIEGGDECDDGDADDGDGCSASCRIEAGWTCSGAPSVCTGTCGDGRLVGGEGCDDGNTRAGDGCSVGCTVEPGWSCAGAPSVCAAGCGDGIVSGMEQCDDGGLVAGDGCSASCRIETGWTCSGTPSACAPICGDGIVAGGEACDDDDADSGDGCSATCTVEPGYTCIGTMPSVCSATCGDGIVAGAEACDDADLESGDGCDATCAVEFGYGCTGQPSGCVRIDHAVDVALGDRSGCALTMLGYVRCWGENVQGAVGDGSTTPRFVPSTAALDRVVDVDVGGLFACALRDTGAVWCWGSDAKQQQGPSVTTSTRPTPGPVGGLDAAARIVAIATGQEHVCVLDEEGVVWCWGDNDNRQLGRGGSMTGVSEVPAAVATAMPVVALSAGGDHTCVVLEDGRAACWGDDDQGQLGDGNTNTDQSLPVPVTGLADVAEIAAGFDHTCARTGAGAVYCWGDNARGQLGIGTVPDETTPAAVTLPGPASAIAAGRWHSCALVAGAAYCWGDNADGQLGDGSRLFSRLPRPVVASETFVAIDAGETGTCAVTAGGARFCWGEGDIGQLGLLPAQQREPSPVTLDASRVLALEGARPRRHAVWCAAQSSAGTLSCWGNAETGLVPEPLGTDAIVPRPFVPAEGVLELGFGEDFGCARMGAGVSCWGDGSQRQLGQGSAVADLVAPTPVMGLAPGTVQLAVGRQFVCARDGGGAVRCWGDSSLRQIGLDGTTDSGVPTLIPAAAGAITIAAGEGHACAIVDATGGAGGGAGEVRCWGDDTNGQLGDGSPSGQRHEAAAVTELAPATALAMGRDHSCALLLSGRVACWGEGSLGQIGDGGAADRAAPREVVGLTDVVQIAAGWDHTCARRADGRVWCWGLGGDGQLGAGFTASGAMAFSATPIELAGVSGATDVRATLTSTCARDGGGVRCVGFHAFGQMGAGLTLRPMVATGAPL